MNPLRVELVSDIESLPALAAQWESLNLRCSDHDAPMFQSYAWNLYTARLRSRNSAGRFKALVATVWRGDALIGVWPLALMRSAGCWIAHSLDHPFGQFAGVAFAETGDIAPGVAAMLRQLRGVADGLAVDGVLVGTPLHAALLQAGARGDARQQAVFVTTKPFRTFGEFEQSMKGETRRRLRNRTKRLRQAHEITHLVTTDGDRLEEIVRTVFDGRLQWLHDNGRTSPAFRDEAFKAVLTELPHAPGVELIGFRLATKDAEISTHWGFVYGGKYYWYMSAMKPGFDDFSPGLLHLGMIIEACIERGLAGLELMPPASRYKLEWSDQVKDLETMAMPFTVKGRALLAAKHRLEPAARRLSRMLPETLRKSLIRLINRD